MNSTQKYYSKNKAKLDANSVIRNRELRRKLRRQVIEILGGKCSICQNDDHRVLDVDHIDGTGFLLRKGNQRANLRLAWFREILAGTASNAQLLCANCHRIKTYEKGENSGLSRN